MSAPFHNIMPMHRTQPRWGWKKLWIPESLRLIREFAAFAITKNLYRRTMPAAVPGVRE